MLNLKLRKVPAKDGTPGQFDVIVTSRGQLQNIRWAWYLQSKPDYRHRYVTLNCYRYRIQWERAQ